MQSPSQCFEPKQLYSAWDLCLIKENERTKRSFDFSDSHKTKAKTTIESLGRIDNIDCIVKICANIYGFIHSFFHVKKGKHPLIYKLCIKMIDCITHQELPCWHSANIKLLPHLPNIYMFTLQHVFLQQTKFMWNTLNTNKVEMSIIAAVIVTKKVDDTVKYITRFFKKMDNHLSKDTVPDSVPCWKSFQSQEE